MIDNPLRKKSYPIGSRVAKALLLIRFKPNTWSVLGLPFALLAAYFLYLQDYPKALVFVLVAALCDYLDGTMAKVSGQITKFGNYLDAMMDRIVEIIIFFGFAFYYPMPSFFAISGSLLMSYSKARAAMLVKIGNRDVPAIGERADRMILLMVGMLLAIFLPKIYGYDTLAILLVLIGLMSYIGTLQRFIRVQKVLR
ncbi:MAG: CDP-alcohol phosphatidyltransferase family protein [Nanoarchaeota archaeon]|nr:CDP-alcohol phosphatidyltransferase family protein [Nanoarchaeota archaeon]